MVYYYCITTPTRALGSIHINRHVLFAKNSNFPILPIYNIAFRALMRRKKFHIFASIDIIIRPLKRSTTSFHFLSRRRQSLCTRTRQGIASSIHANFTIFFSIVDDPLKKIVRVYYGRRVLRGTTQFCIFTFCITKPFFMNLISRLIKMVCDVTWHGLCAKHNLAIICRLMGEGDAVTSCGKDQNA